MNKILHESGNGYVYEETLSDGSKVYNVRFQDHIFGATSKRGAMSLFAELERSCAWVQHK